MAGLTYVLVNVASAPATPMPGLEDLRLSFDDGRVEATMGCNTVSGDYTFDDRVLEVTDLAMTDLRCPNLEVEEVWLRTLFSKGRLASAGADGIAFMDSEPMIELLEESVLESQPPLVGTDWVATGDFVEGDILRPFESAVPGRLLLRDDGTYRAFDGCVEVTGTYALVGERGIDLSSPTSPGDGSCGEYQAQFRMILGSGTSYIIRGPSMNTFNGGGGVFFSAADAEE